MNYRFLLFILFISATVFAQIDSIPYKGTIKVGNSKSENYIKAYANFLMYNPQYFVSSGSYQDFIKAIALSKPVSKDKAVDPQPILFNWGQEFDYNSYFNSNIGLKYISLKGKNCDTIQIIIQVFNDGKFDYYFTKHQSINAKRSIESKKYSEAQMGVMAMLDVINKWEPGYHMVPQKSKKKKKKKPDVKEILNAEGLLTVIISKTPFEE